MQPDRPWTNADRETVALALAGRVRYSQHGQRCPVWTRAKGVEIGEDRAPTVAELARCDCWIMAKARRDGGAVLDALTGGPEQAKYEAVTELDGKDNPDQAGALERFGIDPAEVDALDEGDQCEVLVLADPLLDDTEECGNPLPCDDHRAGPDPEPAGDGPGWERLSITTLIEDLRAGTSTYQVWADQVVALLASHDRLERVAHEGAQYARRTRDELVAARAELAEVTAARDRLARSLGEANEDTKRAREQRDAREAELATARRDTAAATLQAAVYGEVRLCDDCKRNIGTMAAGIRAELRPVPGSPEPAQAAGEEGVTSE